MSGVVSDIMNQGWDDKQLIRTSRDSKRPGEGDFLVRGPRGQSHVNMISKITPNTQTVKEQLTKSFN